ncbi:MAG: K(+)-transporting ATPase subunit F [Verrucomicrobiales bacterium]|nr:K(+)-transporting ATPase subunit F [Verrucomicrobiales bacterium]
MLSHDHRLRLPLRPRCLLRHQRLLRQRLRIPLTPTSMETILAGIIALALLAYLTVAMLRPEKF